MKTKWAQAWCDKRFRWFLLIALFDLALTLYFFTLFLSYAEERMGIEWFDPLLNLFPPLDVSVITFSITYFSVLLGIFFLVQQPKVFLRVLQAYSVMILVRMLCIFILPLEPPKDIIPLNDPFLHNTFYQGRDNLKDLFFSGHTATLFLFYFFSQTKFLRLYFVVTGFVVGILVMLQHVHFFIDVLVAPFFAWLAFKISGWMERKMSEM